MSKRPMDLARNLEKYNLNKKTLNAILSALKKRWRKNPRANAGYIAAATAIQGALILTPDHIVQKFWGDFWIAIRYLEQLNAMHGDSDLDLDFFRDKLTEGIESGALFGDGEDG